MNAAGLQSRTESQSSIPSIPEEIDSPESGVQIWIAQLDSISVDDILDLNASLDSAEQARAVRFHFERDRRHFIAARGILRCLLAAALKIPVREVVFEYGSHGKPTISASNSKRQDVRFNVSHAGVAMFALTRGREIGIDIEAVSHLTGKAGTLPKLAARILSPRELQIWHAIANDAARARALLRAWTRKEAYVKATGKGLFDDRLQEIEVALDAADPQRVLTTDGWTVHDLPAPAGLVAALAVEQVIP